MRYAPGEAVQVATVNAVFTTPHYAKDSIQILQSENQMHRVASKLGIHIGAIRVNEWVDTFMRAAQSQGFVEAASSIKRAFDDNDATCADFKYRAKSTVLARLSEVRLGAVAAILLPGPMREAWDIVMCWNCSREINPTSFRAYG